MSPMVACEAVYISRVLLGGEPEGSALRRSLSSARTLRKDFVS